MAKLFKFQDLEQPERHDYEPVRTAISSDACTLIVGSNKSQIHVYKRNGSTDTFSLSRHKFSRHSSTSTLTALALEDAGVHAASGDETGALYIWRTDDPNVFLLRKFKVGSIKSISVSRQFLLVSCYDAVKKKGVMALIRKGLNMHDEWNVVKRWDGNFSSCTVSEHGKPLNPHVMYYKCDEIVHEQKPYDSCADKITPLKEMHPWCMRRNIATGLLVFIILVERKMLLWAPNAPNSKESLLQFDLSSDENLKINNSLAMSSVVTSAIYLACIYDGKVHVIKTRRIKDIVEESDNISIDGKGKLNLKSVSGTKIIRNKDTSDPKTVRDVLTEHVKNPGQGMKLSGLPTTDSDRTEKSSKDLGPVSMVPDIISEGSLDRKCADSTDISSTESRNKETFVGFDSTNDAAENEREKRSSQELQGDLPVEVVENLLPKSEIVEEDEEISKPAVLDANSTRYGFEVISQDNKDNGKILKVEKNGANTEGANTHLTPTKIEKEVIHDISDGSSQKYQNEQENILIDEAINQDKFWKLF